MPYIGRGLGPQGAFRILDDISLSSHTSGGFNGSRVTFALTVATASLTVGLPETLIIAVDGVIQEAGSAYTISGSNIVFGSAPQDAATFWGVELGDVGVTTAHTVASHSDTTGTGPELDTLTGGGATALHSHAASAVFPVTAVHTNFETEDRFATAGTTGGSNSWGEQEGMIQRTTSTATRDCMIGLFLIRTSSGAVFKRQPSFRCNFRVLTSGTNYTGFCGFTHPNIFVNGVWTPNSYVHLGFKFVRVSSGAITLYAVMGTGSASSSTQLTTFATTDNMDVAFKVASDNGTNITSCNFYYSKSMAAWSSATELTANGPAISNGEENMRFGVGNGSAASNTEVYWHTASYESS